MTRIFKLIIFLSLFTSSAFTEDYNHEQAEDYCSEAIGFFPETTEYEDCVEETTTEYDKPYENARDEYLRSKNFDK